MGVTITDRSTQNNTNPAAQFVEAMFDDLRCEKTPETNGLYRW